MFGNTVGCVPGASVSSSLSSNHPADFPVLDWFGRNRIRSGLGKTPRSRAPSCSPHCFSLPSRAEVARCLDGYASAAPFFQRASPEYCYCSIARKKRHKSPYSGRTKSHKCLFTFIQRLHVFWATKLNALKPMGRRRKRISSSKGSLD